MPLRTGGRKIVVLCAAAFAIASVWIEMACSPSAHADPLTQEDLIFIDGAATLGMNPSTLRLSRGLPEEAEIGRTICNDLMGKNVYSTPGTTKLKLDPESEVRVLQHFLPQMGQDDLQNLVLSAVTSYSACGNTRLPWVDYNFRRPS